MTSALSGARVEIVPGRGEHPLPGPVARGSRILGKESARKLHVAGARSKVGTVLALNGRDVITKGCANLNGQQGDAILLSLGLADEKVAGRKVDVLDAKARALEQAQA